jgi:hypothetical protein
VPNQFHLQLEVVSLAQVQQWAKWLKAMPGLSAIGKRAEQDSKQ